jgi:UDP:flavonoid glycosyltransferase YjiC (YdhE family)
MTRVLFIVNGLGLGNSTRCHSVIQSLHERGAKISVATSGNGLWYFGDRPEFDKLIELQSLHYGDVNGKISIAKTILSVPQMVGVLKSNARILMQILKKDRPDVVVTDSEYSFRPMKRLGIPIVALNNSDVVVQSFKKIATKPNTIRSQFYTVEYTDYLYHRTIPDRVLSPTLEPNLSGINGQFHRIAPIVRRECHARAYSDKPARVVIMLSGSVFGSPVRLSNKKFPFHIDVLGRSAPSDYHDREGITYHSKVKESLEILASADLVIINGGFSAVSEAFVMKKPMLVIPVPRHAEQWINGETIRKLGVGTTTDEENLENAMIEAFDSIGEFQQAYAKLPVIRNGATEAADEILRFIRTFS